MQTSPDCLYLPTQPAYLFPQKRKAAQRTVRPGVVSRWLLLEVAARQPALLNSRAILAGEASEKAVTSTCRQSRVSAASLVDASGGTLPSGVPCNSGKGRRLA